MARTKDPTDHRPNNAPELIGEIPTDLAPWELDRLLASFTVTDGDACWPWERLLNLNGYGRFRYSKDHKSVFRYAHRVLYTLLVGPIPAGLELNHKCRTRNCVRPSHVEPVDGDWNRAEATDERWHGAEAMRAHDERERLRAEVPI